MKNLFTHILLFTYLVSSAQTAFLMDVVNSDTIGYQLTELGENEDINFTFFKLNDSVKNDLMVDSVLSYFEAIHSSDSLMNILQNHQNKIDETLENLSKNKGFNIDHIKLIPIAYLNSMLYLKYAINYTKENDSNHSFFNMYYAYNIETGEVLNQDQLKSGTNTKKLFKALNKKWSKLSKQLKFDEQSVLIDQMFLKQNEVNDSTQSIIVLPQIANVLDSMRLDDVEMYWTGAGIMVHLKDFLFSYTKEQFLDLRMHLDLNEIPKGCFKHSVFPKSYPKRTIQTHTNGFKSLLSLDPITNHFTKNYLNLLKVDDKDIELMDLTLKASETSKLKFIEQWVYRKGKLRKRVFNPDNIIHTVDSVLWNKDVFTGYVRTQVNDTIQTQKFITCLKWDKHDNVLAFYKANENINIQRSVFIGNAIASFTYNVFEDSNEDLHVNWYSKHKKGWTFTNTHNGKSEMYITKSEGPYIIGDRTFLYNSKRQLVQEWNGRFSFLFYGFDKQNRLQEVVSKTSGSNIKYQYTYDEMFKVKTILKKGSKDKEWQKYSLQWE